MPERAGHPAAPAGAARVAGAARGRTPGHRRGGMVGPPRADLAGDHRGGPAEVHPGRARARPGDHAGGVAAGPASGSSGAAMSLELARPPTRPHRISPDALVLGDRPLRPGILRAATSRFGDLVWDLSPAIFYASRR